MSNPWRRCERARRSAPGPPAFERISGHRPRPPGSSSRARPGVSGTGLDPSPRLLRPDDDKPGRRSCGQEPFRRRWRVETMPTLSLLRRNVRRLPLRGADLVLMARHPLWKGVGLSSNTSLVVECDGAITPERVERALDRFLDVCPWPAARLRRPFPWGKLHWAAGPRATLVPPPVRHRSVASRDELHAALETELNSAIDPRRDPPVRFLIIDCGPEPERPQSVLVLTWFHPFMDPRGGQNLLMHLAHLDRDGHQAPWGGAPPAFVPDPDRRP